MHTNWELRIFHELPEQVEHLNSFTAGDIDGDGRMEFLTGNLWYRPETNEVGTIAAGDFHVEARLEDLDGDGRLEYVGSFTGAGEETQSIQLVQAGDPSERPLAALHHRRGQRRSRHPAGGRGW